MPRPVLVSTQCVRRPSLETPPVAVFHTRTRSQSRGDRTTTKATRLPSAASGPTGPTVVARRRGDRGGAAASVCCELALRSDRRDPLRRGRRGRGRGGEDEQEECASG